jgi:hypothetical protein
VNDLRNTVIEIRTVKIDISQVHRHMHTLDWTEALKFYWTKTQEQRDTGTLVLGVSQDTANLMPRSISLYGVKKPIIQKITKPRIQQCKRCWGFHNERTCTRKVRCRLCSSKEHAEEGHIHLGPAISSCNCPNRCTNCRGPHSADDIGCPIRPYYCEGAIQHKTKTQKEAIQKSQSAAYYARYTTRSCKEKSSQSETESQTETALPNHALSDSTHNYQANSPSATNSPLW